MNGVLHRGSEESWAKTLLHANNIGKQIGNIWTGTKEFFGASLLARCDPRNGVGCGPALCQ